jgi:hypothetical protein
MGKHLDRWREFPVKQGPMDCSQLRIIYRAAVKTADTIEKKKVPHFQPWRIKVRRGDKSLDFYWVSTRITREVRNFVADNWRDCGYDVAIRKDAIYVRKKA